MKNLLLGAIFMLMGTFSFATEVVESDKAVNSNISVSVDYKAPSGTCYITIH